MAQLSAVHFIIVSNEAIDQLVKNAHPSSTSP